MATDIMHYAQTWVLFIWMCMIAISLMVTFAAMIFLFTFRRKPIVAMGQPYMLLNMCASMLLVIAGSVFWVMPAFVGSHEVDVGLCSTAEWAEFVGYTAVMTILHLKLYRTYKVVQFRRGQIILSRHVLVPFYLIVLLTMAFSIIKQVFYPPTYVGDPTGVEGLTGYCCNSAPGSIAFWWVKQVIITLLQFGLVVFAWKLRNVDEDIGDSKRILRFCVFFAVSSTANLFIAGIVRLLSSEISLKTRSTIRNLTFVIFDTLSVLALVGFLVLPRMYYVWYERVYGSLPENTRIYGTGKTHVNAGTRTKGSTNTIMDTASKPSVGKENTLADFHNNIKSNSKDHRNQGVSTPIEERDV